MCQPGMDGHRAWAWSDWVGGWCRCNALLTRRVGCCILWRLVAVLGTPGLLWQGSSPVAGQGGAGRCQHRAGCDQPGWELVSGMSRLWSTCRCLLVGPPRLVGALWCCQPGWGVTMTWLTGCRWVRVWAEGAGKPPLDGAGPPEPHHWVGILLWGADRRSGVSLPGLGSSQGHREPAVP